MNEQNSKKIDLKELRKNIDYLKEASNNLFEKLEELYSKLSNHQHLDFSNSDKEKVRKEILQVMDNMRTLERDIRIYKRLLRNLSYDLELETFGNYIRKCREKKNLSLEEAAKKLGITKAALSRWEHSKVLPRASFIKKLAEFYGVKEDTLIELYFKEKEKKEK